MANTWFQFKQFKVEQSKAAMKVGTDGVLLGAWVDVENRKTALDIGTGTGLIALMLAQKNINLKIDAVELDKSASIQAEFNFKSSPWLSRLKIFNSSIQDFNNKNKYDLIVSNPPYFDCSFLAKGQQRQIARHTNTLSIDDLIKSAKRLLNRNGKLSLILPYTNSLDFITIAKEHQLYLNRITKVYPTNTSQVKRALIEFSFNKDVIREDKLVIEPTNRHEYSKEYIDLTKDFYLKL